MKIVHFVDSGGGYGIERMLQSLLPEMIRLGHEVSLVFLNTFKDENADFVNHLRYKGVDVFFPKCSSKYYIGTLWYIITLVIKQKPALLHFHGYKATVLGGIVGALLRKPSIVSYHAEARHSNDYRKILRIEAFVLRKFIDGVAAVSAPINEELIERGISKNNIRVIPNGIDGFDLNYEEIELPITNLPKERPIVLYTGRLIQKKNIHILIDAIKMLKVEIPTIQLVIAGDGPYKDELMNKVQQNDLYDTVHFLGYVINIMALYAFCDCFVLPSQTEGMPISLLEAMCCSKPIVISSVGSIPDIVTDGYDALLIEPGNIEMLSTAIKKILIDPSLSQQLGGNARRTFLESYTSEIMAQKYVDFYYGIIGSVSNQ